MDTLYNIGLMFIAMEGMDLSIALDIIVKKLLSILILSRFIVFM